jgi:hypothetical protein
MKRLQRVSEAEVISEFLKNEFYHPSFHEDRGSFEDVVLQPDLNDELENSIRRALLYRRRGHMWRELPADTDWWLVELEPEDLQRIRVFPRAQWRKVAGGSYQVSDIVERIRSNHFRGSSKDFIAKVQSLSYHLRRENDDSSILLIGVDEQKPLTILEGNHRLTAAVLASPELARTRFRVIAGFSQSMNQCCWYETNFSTLWRYFKHRMRNVHDRDADVNRIKRPAAEVAAAEASQNRLRAATSVSSQKPAA